MHIYAFGSVCRGEVAKDSDVDLLVLTNGEKEDFAHDAYSIYSYERMNQLWREGNPFAWHLFYESKMIFSNDGGDYLHSIKKPGIYKEYQVDFSKFYTLLTNAIDKVNNNSNSLVFELSNIFLAIRNIAMCYSLAHEQKPVFSRHSAKLLGEKSIKLGCDSYHILERCRILGTRGIGDNITSDEVSLVQEQFGYIKEWALSLKARGDDEV